MSSVLLNPIGSMLESIRKIRRSIDSEENTIAMIIIRMLREMFTGAFIMIVIWTSLIGFAALFVFAMMFSSLEVARDNPVGAVVNLLCFGWPVSVWLAYLLGLASD